MPSTCCWATMSWSVSSFVPAFSAPIFETDIAPMTTSARIIAPKAMPRRYASRKLLKRDIRFLPGRQVVQGAPAGARRFIRCLGDRPHPRHFECSAVVLRSIDPRGGRRQPGGPERLRPRTEDPDGAAETTGGFRRSLSLRDRELADEPLELLRGAGQAPAPTAWHRCVADILHT